MKLELLEEMLAARRAGNATALLTDLATGAQALLGDAASDREAAAQLFSLTASELAELDRAIQDDRCRTLDRADGGAIFVEIWSPPPRLYVVGAVHIAQALIPMAAALGYALVLIDPRPHFASAERFPGVELVHDWPDEALSRARLDKRSAVVTLTHDPKIDDPALAEALRSPAFYIGALGSRRTHGARLERLLGTGFPRAETARIRGPVGLAIGAVTPAEIAVSILAEMTAALRRHPLAERSAA